TAALRRPPPPLPAQRVEQLAPGVYNPPHPPQPTVDAMRRLGLIVLAAAVAASPAAATAARPVSGAPLLAIDRSAGFRSYLPTRMLPRFAYVGWLNRGGVLRVDFRNTAGRTVVWSVARMTGACDAGKQKSFQ